MAKQRPSKNNHGSERATSGAPSDRHRFALTTKQLLADYAAISRKRRGAAAACAIRHRSRQYLDILAAQATEASCDWSELRDQLQGASHDGAKSSQIEPMAQAEIGRVLLLHPADGSDAELGIAMLEDAVTRLPKNMRSRKFRLLLVQQHILDGRLSEAEDMLRAWRDIREIEEGYLAAEIRNPFVADRKHDFEEWIARFNESIVKYGLEPIYVNGGDGEPFDRLSASYDPARKQRREVGDEETQPTVSVVMTAYQPSVRELLTSVQSILRQSVVDLELIIVDDGSGEAYKSVFDKVKTLDERIRLIRVPTNLGTYAARNRGYRESVGRFITGQDDDDWSHPQRLQIQVDYMNANPDSAGCRVSGIMCSPNLSRLRAGYTSINSNASSLMIRKEDFERTGGFIEMRKAADTEFMRRLERMRNSTVKDLPHPLTLVRILSDSLSRSDFGAGWSHPARRQVKSSYTHWHNTADLQSLQLTHSNGADIHVPRRFRVTPESKTESFDVVLAGDWRQYGGPQKSMIEEIRALRSHGYKVAILHLEAPRFMSAATKFMTPHIQQLINEGAVGEVLYDDEVHVRLLVLRYPPILQFVPDDPSGLRVDKMFVMANQAPSERDGSDIRYIVRDCQENAKRVFTPNVTWVPQGPQVREAIEPVLASCELEPFDIPGIVDPADWSTGKTRRARSPVPVIGRHSRDNVMKWPEDAATIEAVYPTSGLLDVRIMGGSGVPNRVLQRDNTPPAWIVYGTDAMPVRDFLRTLDFYVFYQNSIAVEAFGRAILEAIAANLVVVLPPHYESVFGASAVYADPEEVATVIQKYHSNRSLYERQQVRAQGVLEAHFTHEAYARRIGDTIGCPGNKDGA